MDQRHVDIVRNQPHGGYSELVARLFLENVGDNEVIAIAVVQREHWARLFAYLEQPIATERGPVYASKDASDYLEQLHLYLSNDYIFATDLHGSDECPHKQVWKPMEPVSKVGSSFKPTQVG